MYPSVMDMQATVEQREFERAQIERKNRMLRAAALPPLRIPLTVRIADRVRRTKSIAPSARPEPCAACG